MTNFSIDYLTRKDCSSSEGEGSPRSFKENSNSSPENSDGSLISTVSGKHDKDKPSHSYIALISMSILNSREKKILLGDIYQYIMDNFPYYNNKEKAWRNSVRHNLSLNECFIKSGRADNGKGNFWSIHPACIDDFSRGDFRRRQARRRARKSAMPEMSVSEMPLSYRSNLGYVPMTTSALPFTPVSSSVYYPMSTYALNSMTPGRMYPSLTGTAPTAYVNQINSSSTSQHFLPVHQSWGHL